MNKIYKLLKDQRGMTGLETAIILIAFVTVAAVFGYAILSAGLFSAERGKETIYAGLNEARSNLELSGSVMARSDDNANVRSILFTVKNAIAGNPIDLTPCNGTSNASNKCVISLSTGSDYINNVKWNKVAIGSNNGNDLLEIGEQFEITVDLTDLGAAGSLSENLTANDKFSLQVKPALGSTITIQRTLPASIGPIMDLDLMFGSGGSGSGSTGGTGETISFELTNPTLSGVWYDFNSVASVSFYMQNTGTSAIEMTRGIGCTVNAMISGGPTIYNMDYGSTTIWQPGYTGIMSVDFTEGDLVPGATFTIEVIPLGGPTLSFTRTVPDPITDSPFDIEP